MSNTAINPTTAGKAAEETFLATDGTLAPKTMGDLRVALMPRGRRCGHANAV